MKRLRRRLHLGTVVSLGRPKLKNIAERFAVYASYCPNSPKDYARPCKSNGSSSLVGCVRCTGSCVVGLVLLGGIVTFLSPSLPTFITHHSSFITQEAQPPALPLPDKPSIIVLPFANMSEDPEQDYFSDGITEDITSDLSKISSLFVIARNSAFTYKGKAVKVQDVSREMGVRYVLEGSVRKADNRCESPPS